MQNCDEPDSLSQSIEQLNRVLGNRINELALNTLILDYRHDDHLNYRFVYEIRDQMVERCKEQLQHITVKRAIESLEKPPLSILDVKTDTDESYPRRTGNFGDVYRLKSDIKTYLLIGNLYATSPVREKRLLFMTSEYCNSFRQDKTNLTLLVLLTFLRWVNEMPRSNKLEDQIEQAISIPFQLFKDNGDFSIAILPLLDRYFQEAIPKYAKTLFRRKILNGAHEFKDLDAVSYYDAMQELINLMGEIKRKDPSMIAVFHNRFREFFGKQWYDDALYVLMVSPSALFGLRHFWAGKPDEDIAAQFQERTQKGDWSNPYHKPINSYLYHALMFDALQKNCALPVKKEDRGNKQKKEEAIREFQGVIDRLQSFGARGSIAGQTPELA